MSPEQSHQMIAEILLTVQRLESEVQSLKSRLEGHPGIADGWLRSKKAAIALKSEGVLDDKHLRKLLRAGVFSASKNEIRNRSEGNRPTWEFNIPKCRDALRRYFKEFRVIS
jgi:hypothetical protein